jgi:ornithine decarboxylase
MHQQEHSREVAAIWQHTRDAVDFSAARVVNLRTVRHKFQQWKEHLPQIEPFYAVKSNPDSRLLATLAKMGCGFDCASVREIEMALSSGVGPEKIVYANPVKDPAELSRAVAFGVRLMTFDNSDELRKIKQACPSAELLLRILVDDSMSVCKMGQKYGASSVAVPALLTLAKNLQLNIRGVSFHVGSGALDPTSFSNAVSEAKRAFFCAAELGLPNFDTLDIGGGFPGNFVPSDASSGTSFSEIAASLQSALELHFPTDGSLQVIAEPGRFFSCASQTLATQVIGRREPDNIVGGHFLNGSMESGFRYYISEGLYSSFNCVLYDHVNIAESSQPTPLSHLARKHTSHSANDVDVLNPPAFPASLWGPTCDGFDCVTPSIELPLLDVGDWLVFRNMGAYTSAAASNFNGFPNPRVIYID